MPQVSRLGVITRRPLVGAAASVAAVAAVTGAIYPIKLFAPVLSLGAIYLLAILPVAVLWGLTYAVPVSVASMLAFNFFHLPPLHTFRLRESENWFALAVYLVTAIVVSELATRSRRRALEAQRLARKALEAETLRESDAIKTAVLQAVSHDLRSPLTAISAAASGLGRDDLTLDDSDRADLVRTIQAESGRLNRLVGNLLDLSRLQVGAARPNRELWTVDEIVSQALGEVGAGSERIEARLPADLPAVSVDAVQLQRVLLNLLENALKFSTRGPVTIEVTCDAAEVFIRIEDRGPGVPRGELEYVFEPFRRSSASSKRSGAGLGLAIAKGFAEANGGRIWAESRVDVGAIFVLALPIVPARMPAPA